MPIDNFTRHLEDYPRGREYSYMVSLTGSPFAWSDGKAEWGSVPMIGYEDVTVINGALASTDWTFDFNADPTNPLDLGGGVSVVLLDEASRRTRRFFSPNFEGGYSTRLTAAATGAATTFTVVDASGFANDSIGYVGLETVQITANTPSTTPTVTRGMFGSLAVPHNLMYGDDAILGPKMTLSPRVQRGRFLSIWIAPVQDDGTLPATDNEFYKVWAGRVASVDFEGSLIKISCDPLLAGMTKDEWPPPLPTGNFGGTEPLFYFKESDLTISLKAKTADTDWYENLATTRLGYRDSAGTFGALPSTDGWFSLSQITKYLTDTIHNFLYSTALLGTSYETEIYNNFSISVVTGNTPGTLAVVVNKDIPITIVLNAVSGIGKWIAMRSAFTLLGMGGSISLDNGLTLAVFQHTGIHLSATDTEVLYYPDNRYDPLSTDHGYSDSIATDTGFARIYNGESFELISFTGEESAGIDGQRRLTGVVRGLGGTSARAWGGNTDTEAGDAISTAAAPKIAQVWMISRNNQPLPVQNFILPALCSSGYGNGPYDLLGARLGLAIPKEFIAYEEMEDTVRSLGLDAPSCFWVTEPKKGKEDFASFLQSNGLHFVTKRFAVYSPASRSAYNYFGITVAPLDMTSRSTYLREVTDADRSASTSVTTDFNERLIINSIRLTPFYYFNKDASEIGGNVYAYAEESIAEYGAYKTLEVRPAALYASITAGGTLYNSQQDMYVGLAAKIGLRWFGAFANGSYLLTMECPHTGWRYQPGMPVRISLTGVTSPEADDNLTDLPARIMDVKHRHGSRPGATITARLAFGGGPVELAPCMQVTAHAGGTALTIAPTLYSLSDQMIPYPSVETAGGVTNDSHWFDYTEHGAGNFSVYCWELGDYANGQTKVVSAVTHGGASDSTVTITTALSAGLQTAATAGRLIITLPAYGDASISDLSKTFAYVGSNASPSLLDGTDDTADYV